MSEVPPSTSYTPPPPPPPGPPSAPANSNRTLMLVLSYLGLLAIIPLVAEKEDKEVQWHAKNGLAIAISMCVIWIPLWILARFIPFMGCLVLPIACVFPLIIIAIAVIGIMKALNGQRLRIPVISDFADKM